MCGKQDDTKHNLIFPQCFLNKIFIVIFDFYKEFKIKQYMTLSEILRDSNYRLTQFNIVEIHNLEKKIKLKTDKNGKEIPYINCLIRKKDIKLTPEETIRQMYLQVLMDYYGYPTDRIELEYSVSFGREKKRADIVIFDKDQTTVPYIMVELKKPKLKDGKEQLKSYCNATGAPIGIWTNGESISYYHRKDPNYFEDIPQIPKATEKLSDIYRSDGQLMT